MRVGLFGGSFDPVHNGHVRPVLEVMEKAGLDRVIYCPTAQPPHKPGRDFAPALLRYAMVELALLPHPRLHVSALELQAKAPTYTYDTVRHFQASRPDWDLQLLMGVDAFDELDEYHRWADILEAIPILVMLRAGCGQRRPATDPRPAVEAAVKQGRVSFLTNRTVAASSTKLREIFAEGGDPPDGWVPDAVVELIHKYRLYR